MTLDLHDIALILDAGAQKADDLGELALAVILTEMADTAVKLRDGDRRQYSWYADLRNRNEL